MWMPTHVQVTVQRAEGLLTKGKNDTNDCFVTIALGKTKYQTSVKKRAEKSVEWHEECELPIPEQGNTAEIILTVLHQSLKNFISVDEFLGRVNIPLNTLDTYERPKNRWYTLQSKPGKEDKGKERGKLEVKIAFTVKSGSLNDLSKKEKHKLSIGHVSQKVGGSLLSISSMDKRKGIKKFAKSIGSKMHLRGKKKDDLDDASLGSVGSLKRKSNMSEPNFRSKQTFEDADPGVVSDDDDDFMFDDLSHKSSASSLNQSPNQFIAPKHHSDSPDANDDRRQTLPPFKPPRLEVKTDEWELKLNKNKANTLKPNSMENLNRRSWESPTLSARIEEEDASDGHLDIFEDSTSVKSKSPEPEKKESMFSKLRNLRKDRNEDKVDKSSNERVIIGGENDMQNSVNSRISNELMQKFEGKSKEDLILLVCELQSDLDHSKKKLKDLEDYLDDLLLRVMETTPRILQNPYVNCKLAHKKITG